MLAICIGFHTGPGLKTKDNTKIFDLKAVAIYQNSFSIVEYFLVSCYSLQPNKRSNGRKDRNKETVRVVMSTKI